MADGDGHAIDQLLQHQRHADIRQVGAEHEQQRQRDPPSVGPQIGQQDLDGGPIAAFELSRLRRQRRPTDLKNGGA